MARRIDVELTSARDDGTWTWRAAGAKQPKGVLDGSLLYEGAKVGDVVRAEAEFEIDGITITSVTPPKEKKRAEPERLQVLGPQQRDQSLVTSSLVPKNERRREGRGPRRDGEGGERRDRPAGERRDRPALPPKPKRLSPANVHRAAVLATLPPEQRPVAEQVLRGGIPAVRTAIEAQNTQLKEAGQPPVKPEPLLALAEELLPRLKAADWRDRAEAAAKDVDEIAIRDLRSVVAGAEAGARDDESRLLASTLREALERRLARQRDEWVAEIARCLDEGRLVRALRVSGRPPDSATRFPAELSQRLAEAASQALSPEASTDRWVTVLDAVATSPVRRAVKPAGLPAEPSEQLLRAAKQASGSIPALTSMLGIDIPPPPLPRRPPRPPKPAGRRPPGPGDPAARPPRPGAAHDAATSGEAGVPERQPPPAEAAAEQGSEYASAEQPSKTPSAEQASETPSAEQASETPSAEQASETPSAEQASETPSAEQPSETPSAEQAGPGQPPANAGEAEVRPAAAAAEVAGPGPVPSGAELETPGGNGGDPQAAAREREEPATNGSASES